MKINDKPVTFSHRLSPFSATHLVVKGDVTVFTVILSIPATGVPSHALWTQLGGHFRCIESSPNGVTWALGQDGTCWIHTGSHGGGFFKGLFGASSHGIHPINDEGFVYLYENQRWNPVAGFSPRGLPTDRAPWSDVTGRQTYDKDTMSLPNKHWTWVCLKIIKPKACNNMLKSHQNGQWIIIPLMGQTEKVGSTQQIFHRVITRTKVRLTTLDEKDGSGNADLPAQALGFSSDLLS